MAIILYIKGAILVYGNTFQYHYNTCSFFTVIEFIINAYESKYYNKRSKYIVYIGKPVMLKLTIMALLIILLLSVYYH